MPYVLLFLKSWVMGLAITAPFDPVEVLCIKKTLQWGFAGALLVGLGATLGHSLYVIIAVAGMSKLSPAFTQITTLLKLIGGLFLLFLAYKEIKGSKNIRPEKTKITTKTHFTIMGQSFFLAAINPITIIGFMGSFSTTENLSFIESCILIAGFFLGSLSWWFILGGIVTRIHHSLSRIWLRRIEIASGVIFATFGIGAIISAIIALK